jgi:hypothetical protein
VKHKIRKAVWTDPNDSSKRGIVTQDTREYSESEDTTERAIRLGEALSKAMPKHSFGHKDLGWVFIKASSIERAKTFDIETASVSHFSSNCTFEAAMAIINQLTQKIYIDFDKEPPAVRQDLSNTNS